MNTLNISESAQASSLGTQAFSAIWVYIQKVCHTTQSLCQMTYFYKFGSLLNSWIHMINQAFDKQKLLNANYLYKSITHYWICPSFGLRSAGILGKLGLNPKSVSYHTVTVSNDLFFYKFGSALNSPIHSAFRLMCHLARCSWGLRRMSIRNNDNQTSIGIFFAA